MATLKDVWNYPNNASSGYVADTDNWSGDNSYGVDERVEDYLTGAYKSWPNINPRTDLSVTSLQGSQAIAKYKHYYDSFGDTTNLSFITLHKRPLVEWKLGTSGHFVTKVELITDGSVSGGANNVLKVTTDTPHGFQDGDQLQGFGFKDTTGSTLSGMNYATNMFCKVIDSTSFSLFNETGRTNSWLYNRQNILSPLYNYYLLDYKGTHTLLLFSEIGRELGRHDNYSPGPGSLAKNPQFVPGDKIKISTAHTGLTGTINGSVGDDWEVLAINHSAAAGIAAGMDQGPKEFLLNKTITSETNYGTTVPYDIVSNGSRVNIEVDLSSSSYAAVRTQLMTYHMHNSPYNIYQVNDNIYDSSATPPIPGGLGSGMGFCRVSITQGNTTSNYTSPGGPWDGTSDKPINSSLDNEYYYNWTYDDDTKMLKVYETALGTARKQLGALQTAPANNIQGEIQFINYWYQNQTGPNSYDHGPYEGQVTHGITAAGGAAWPVLENLTDGEHPGWQTFDEATTDMESRQADLDGATHLRGPMIGLYNRMFDHTGVKHLFNTWPTLSDLKIGIDETTKNMHSPGSITYSYQNSSNVTTYAAGNIDFTNRYDADGSTVTAMTWGTTPVITPSVNGSGKLDNTYTFTEPGAVSWASLSLSDDTDKIAKINAPSDPVWATGVYKFSQRDWEYIAPTPYAEDVFDTNDEWTDDSYAGGAKNWPRHITPTSIKLTQVQPGSTTISQSGKKYVRASGIIRHQMEVSYPPMTEADFIKFETTVTSARGQATPFYFILVSDSGTNLAFRRTDALKDYGIIDPSIRHDVPVGEKIVTLEGFEANQTDAILEGEYLVANTGNGWIVQAISSADSNIYGEAKFRIGQSLMSQVDVGQTLWKNPWHAVVTLAEDSFEYDIGTDMLYRFTVRFNFDNWK